MALPGSYQLTRPPRDDEELFSLVKALWNVVIPRNKVCPDHQAPFDAFATAFFAREPQVLVRGSRGLSGKSQMMSILGLTQAVVLGADNNIVGGSEQQSKNVLEHMKRAWDSPGAPRYMIPNGGNRTQEMLLNNGARIRPLTASQRSVRGPHPARLCVAGDTIVDTPTGSRRIDELEPHDTVFVIDEQHRLVSTDVKLIWSKGIKTTVEVELSDGRVITCTEDHPIWTQRGWVEAAALERSDVLPVWQEDGRAPAQQDRHVQGLLGEGQAGPSCFTSVQHVRREGEDLEEARGVTTVLEVLPPQQSQEGKALRGLQCAVEAGQHQALSSVSSEMDEHRARSSQVRSSASYRTWWDQDQQGRDTGCRVAGSIGYLLSAASQLRHLGHRLLPTGAGYLSGGARGLLARSGEQSSARSAQAGEDHRRRSPGGVLAAGSDAPMGLHVRVVRPGPRTAVYDITTGFGNFVSGGVKIKQCLDEIDEMDADILESAKGQPMPQPNWLGANIPQQTIMVSTLQYSDGVMMKEMQRFEEEGLPVMEWCFRETSNPYDGWLSPNFIEEKKREVSKERWRVEYELGEPGIGNRAFDSQAVERTFDLKVQDHQIIKQAKEYEEYEFEKPRDDRWYVIAADWAQAVDWTVITVWDVTYEPMRLCYYLRLKRRPYPVMVGYFNDLKKRYDAEAIHDATGLGAVVSDLVEGSSVYNFLMTGNKRDNMLSEYVTAVENDRVRAHRVGSIYRSTLFCSVEDLFSRKQEYHLPDEICSAALAWHLAKDRIQPTSPVGLPKVEHNWMDTDITHNRTYTEQHWSKGGKRVEGEVEVLTEEVGLDFTH